MEARARLIGVNELRSHLGKELERLREAAHPLYVTRRGKPAGVLVDVETYEDLLDRIEYLEDSIVAMEARELPEEELVDLDDLLSERQGMD